MVEDEAGNPITAKVGPGCTIFVPESRFHSTKNTGSAPMQLFVVYSPAGPGTGPARTRRLPPASQGQISTRHRRPLAPVPPRAGSIAGGCRRCWRIASTTRSAAISASPSLERADALCGSRRCGRAGCRTSSPETNSTPSAPARSTTSVAAAPGGSWIQTLSPSVPLTRVPVPPHAVLDDALDGLAALLVDAPRLVETSPRARDPRAHRQARAARSATSIHPRGSSTRRAGSASRGRANRHRDPDIGRDRLGEGADIDGAIAHRAPLEQ